MAWEATEAAPGNPRIKFHMLLAVKWYLIIIHIQLLVHHALCLKLPEKYQTHLFS